MEAVYWDRTTLLSELETDARSGGVDGVRLDDGEAVVANLRLWLSKRRDLYLDEGRPVTTTQGERALRGLLEQALPIRDPQLGRALTWKLGRG